jgi:integrase
MAPLMLNALREWRLIQGEGGSGLVFHQRGEVLHHKACPTGRSGAGGGGKRPRYGPLHAFRHFFASWVIEQGFSAKRVQDLLGLASITITYDIYGHLFPPRTTTTSDLPWANYR